MGTHWELEGNMLGTKENEKKKSPHQPHHPLSSKKNLKEKKSRHFECMLRPPIGCIKFIFPKLFIAIFHLA
jgi:hypothetical protein